MPKVVELPGVEGPGVSPVSIPAINRLAEDYIKERDKRVKMTPREVAAKQKLIDAIHKDRQGARWNNHIPLRRSDNHPHTREREFESQGGNTTRRRRIERG